jgi:hypothetical protein
MKREYGHWNYHYTAFVVKDTIFVHTDTANLIFKNFQDVKSVCIMYRNDKSDLLD